MGENHAPSVVRSWLYTPAGRRDWHSKIAGTKADAVVLDLEDGTPDGEKDRAREIVTETLTDKPLGSMPAFYIRINGRKSPHFERDVSAALRVTDRIRGLVLPKVESADDVRCLDAALKGTLEIVPIIELLSGEAHIDEIISASTRIRFVQFAESGDYSADYGLFGKTLDSTIDPVAADFAIRVLKASKRHGLEVIDSAYLAIRDLRGLKRRCDWAFRTGFSGKAALHPCQVPVINKAFSPSASLIRKAERMVRKFEEEASKGTFVPFEGSYITPPKYKAAKQFLERNRGKQGN